jgi:hypothetical protein
LADYQKLGGSEDSFKNALKGKFGENGVAVLSGSRVKN